MSSIIKNLGGVRAVELRIAFLLIAMSIICPPLGRVVPQEIHVAAPTEPVTEVITTTEPTTEPTTEALTETTTAEVKYVALSAESVQNDLRLKFYNQDKNLFKGYNFEITITFPNGKTKVYHDENMDGKINLTKLVAGDYLIVLTVPDGFTAAKADMTVKVKDKIVYKPIQDIKDDMKDESAIGANEQSAIKNTEVEKTLEDTVEHVASTQNVIITYTKVNVSTVAIPTTAPVVSEGNTESESSSSTVESTTAKPQPLLDKSGKPLYIKSGESYIPATALDYSVSGEYYIKTETIEYTGWQVIDGSKYYYDKNHKVVTGEQVISGAKYSFDASGALKRGTGVLGMDVSRFQGNINWNKVKAAGVQFVILRCGGRGYGSSGALYEDKNFESYYAGARAAGLSVGVYFFSAATNDAEALEEASAALSVLKGKKIQYPVFIDIENGGTSGRANNNSKATWTSIAKTFCATVRNSGYKTGVYANKTFWNNKLDANALSAYYIWLAQYNTTVTYSGTYDIWQYTSKGNGADYGVSSTYVDLNLSYIF